MNDIFVEVENCLGCKQCEISCLVEHSKSKNIHLAVNEVLTSYPQTQVFLEENGDFSLSCFHCDDTLCVDACIGGALSINEEGRVSHEVDECINCDMCIIACPDGVIEEYNGQKLIQKCDSCLDEDSPACANVCPIGALVLRGSISCS